MPRNLEIKLACTAEQFERIAGRMRDLPLGGQVRIEQFDTYFSVRRGRLKLRQSIDQQEETAELIQYDRPTIAGARTSTYRRIALSADQAADLREALSESLGIVVAVRKQRTVAIWHATRIHLDEVESLGHFVELETVVADAGSEEAAAAEFANVMDWLQMNELRSIPGSYCDLMTARTED